jgi:outer membrane immunogenic protein
LAVRTFAVNTSGSGSGTQTGELLGMGVEYAFLPNWSAKIEYNFIDFGSRSFSAPISTNPSLAGTPLAGLTAIPFSTTENQHIIKAGLNWFW